MFEWATLRTFAIVLLCLPLLHLASTFTTDFTSYLDPSPQVWQGELDAIMEKYFSDNDNVKSSMVGGDKTAADIVNFLESSVESTLMEQVRNENEELANRIQDLMFVFDNLREVDDRGIQTLLREVSTDLLTLALKGVDEDFQQKFLKNMSSRAAEMLVEDMEAKGPVKLSEVEAAQKEILNIARTLEESGDLVLGGGGEEMV